MNARQAIALLDAAAVDGASHTHIAGVGWRWYPLIWDSDSFSREDTPRYSLCTDIEGTGEILDVRTGELLGAL